MMRVLATVLALVPLLANPGAPPDDVQAELASAIATELVPSLMKLAEWCNQKKLYQSRNALYELVTEFDADHAEARKQLKYTRDTSGKWVQSRPPDVKNRNAKAEEELPAVRAEHLATFRKSLLDLMRRHDLSPFGERGQELLQIALRADPDDAEVRTVLRQVKAGDQWILEETYRARERRAELDSYAKAALEGASSELKEGRLTPVEEGLGIPWHGVIESSGARVVGTVDKSEMKRVAQANHAVGEFFRAVMDSRTSPWEGATLYVFPDEGYRDAFLDSHPQVPPQDRETLRQLYAVGIPGTAHACEFDSDPLRRLDASVRHSFSIYLQSEFEVDANDGWVWEGFGLYLTWRLVGTRLTWYASAADQDSASSQMRGRLLEPDCDWRKEAIGLLSGKSAPDLAQLVGKPLGQMTAADMLGSYALASYLIEGDRADAAKVLKRVGAGDPDVAVLEEALGMEISLVNGRILRWLEEEETTADLDPSQSVASFGGRPKTAAKGGRGKSSITPWVELDAAQERGLLVALEKLSSGARADLLARCVAAARETGARQVGLIDALLAQRKFERKSVPRESEFQAHDALRFKGGSPRRNIGPGNKSWEAVRSWIPPERESSWVRHVRYELSTGRIVASPVDPKDETWQFRNLLVGVLPDQDFAQAILLSKLDATGALRQEAYYFAHTYCDRDARAYEGISLLDAWSAQFTIEVPDPDARAYAILVYDDDSVPVPLSGEDHARWYPRISNSARRVRDGGRNLQALGEVWFQGHPALDHGWSRSIDLLHALVGIDNEDVALVGERFGNGPPDLLDAGKKQVESMGNEGWNRGNERRDALLDGQAKIRKAVLDVLRGEGVL